MKVIPFFAKNPAAALAQIHAELGPEAVVLSVRQTPSTGLGRLWGRNRLEVLAGVMDGDDPAELPTRSAAGTKETGRMSRKSEIRNPIPLRRDETNSDSWKSRKSESERGRVSSRAASNLYQSIAKPEAAKKQPSELNRGDAIDAEQPGRNQGRNSEKDGVTKIRQPQEAALEKTARLMSGPDHSNTSASEFIEAASRSAVAAPESEQHKIGPLCGLDGRTPLRAAAVTGALREATCLEAARFKPEPLPCPRCEAAPVLPPFENWQADLAANIPAASRTWRSIAWIEEMGLLRPLADRLEKRLLTSLGPIPPGSLETEWPFLLAALNEHWRPPPALNYGDGRPHVFIGPSGSGKTTVLCKWLAYAVLTEERSAAVWRLDGANANTSEFLTVHCEMFGVPIQRFWPGEAHRSDLLFLDLPGTEPGDAQAKAALQRQLADMPDPHVHLVLNAAYETSTLLEHFEAFASFKPQDVIFTHMDEEQRRVKLWNFVLGTNCSLRFLSAGQKIPGEFRRAAPGLLFPANKP